jgi:hypothetical protein
VKQSSATNALSQQVSTSPAGNGRGRGLPVAAQGSPVRGFWDRLGRLEIFLNFLDFIPKQQPGRRIQYGHGFIKQDNIRFQGKSAGYGNPLLLAPGQFIGLFGYMPLFRAEGLARVISFSSLIILPLSGSKRPISILRIVVFPQPEGPRYGGKFPIPGRKIKAVKHLLTVKTTDQVFYREFISHQYFPLLQNTLFFYQIVYVRHIRNGNVLE